MVACPHCGAEVEEGQTVCWNCNGSLTGGGAGGEQPANQQGQPPRGQQPSQGQPRQGQPRQQHPPRGQAGQQPVQSQPPQGQPRQGQPPQGQYGQPPRDESGLGRRELLAGGGVLAAAGAGGWFFFLRDDGGAGSPASPGTSLEDAPQVSEGTHGPYEIGSNEQHYFAVELSQGETLTARSEFSHSDGDLDMDLYDPSEFPVDGSASTTDNETVTMTADQDGMYYINLYLYSGSSNEYELDVTVESP